MRLPFVFLAFTACTGLPPNQQYHYPRTEAGKEPVQNATTLRIGNDGLAFFAENFSALVGAVCCEAAGLAADQAASACWTPERFVPCFVDTLGGEQRVNFYLGRSGEPYWLRPPPLQPDVGLTTGESGAPSYFTLFRRELDQSH